LGKDGYKTMIKKVKNEYDYVCRGCWNAFRENVEVIIIDDIALPLCKVCQKKLAEELIK
jgi:predicted SprT family Zn-dependent metalloprotease